MLRKVWSAVLCGRLAALSSVSVLVLGVAAIMCSERVQVYGLLMGAASAGSEVFCAELVCPIMH